MLIKGFGSIKKAYDRFHHLKIRFPEIRSILGKVKLITSFSHANLNLPIDELNNLAFLLGLMAELNLKKEEVLIILYDNAIPELDRPRGDRIQYGVVSPRVMDPRIPYSFQKEAFYREEDIYKRGQNRVESIPDEHQEIFISRFREVNTIYKKYLNRGSGTPLEKIRNIRKAFYGLLGLPVVEEVPFSLMPTALVAEVLNALYQRGYPFWKMPLPGEFMKYKTSSYLVEGISPEYHRVSVKFNGEQFVIQEGKSIHKEDIFEALLKREVIPTMPLIVLSLMVAPQVFHLGGGSWPRYAVPLAREIGRWLGLREGIEQLVLSTGGVLNPCVYKRDKEYYGFPLVYSVYGREFLLNHLNSEEVIRAELQRKVYL